jgi:hypothetical protein
MGLSVKVDGDCPTEEMTPNRWALTDANIEVPEHWQKWLGSIRAGDIKNCTLFLLSKMPSKAPGVLDGENETLIRRAKDYFYGLQLASNFAVGARPVLLSGACVNGEIDVRQQQDWEALYVSVIRPYPPILAEEILQGARLADAIEALSTAELPGGTWRLFRTLDVYLQARTISEAIDRIHQYCRCIDGLILSAAGNAKKQFQSRTHIFIGSRHHEVMARLYDVRSDVEHLHEHRHLETFDRQARLELVQMEATVEFIARNCLARIVGNAVLWPHFANTKALGAFWNLEEPERQRIWGPPMNIADALIHYDPQLIDNGQLGNVRR